MTVRRTRSSAAAGARRGDDARHRGRGCECPQVPHLLEREPGDPAIMRVEVLADVDAVARRAAETIAEQARAAVAARGRFTVAISGGRTPWAMLRVLSTLEVPWAGVHVFQVDERVAPAGDADRNLTQMRATL